MSDCNVLVRSFGLTFSSPSLVPPGSDTWHQFVVAFNGPLMARVESTTFLLAPGGGLWIPAGAGCSFENRSTASIRMLYFPVQLFSSSDFDTKKCRVLAVSALLVHLVNKIVLTGALTRENERQRRLAGVVWDEIEQALELPVALLLPKSKVARRIVDALEQASFRLEALGAAVESSGYSRRTIERLFATETRQTLGSWLRRRRLMLAVDLLASGESVSQVGHILGYSGPSAFVAMFKRELGVAPLEYLRRSRAGGVGGPL